MPKRSPTKTQSLIEVAPIEAVIRVIRGQRVIVDSDLARIYGVDTRVLNQAVKRNLRRFPADFVFQLAQNELPEPSRSRSQSVILNKRGRNIKYLPYAFTEHGAVMAANVLNTEVAVAMSVYVVRAFVKLREVLASTEELAKKLDDLERKLTSRQNVHEKAIVQLFTQLKDLLRPAPPQPAPKRRRIGF
jgi:phage regulator Rha-like protein